MVPEILEKVGSLWGDQREYLTCDNCGGEHIWDDDAPKRCPECDGELCVHVPHGESLFIRYVCWKGDQQWWPQRYFVMADGGESDYRYVQWLGRKWLKRPWNAEHFFGVEEA